MIPAEQTILGFPDGNCFAACVASILEMPLAEVPHFTSVSWFQEWNDWLRPRGFVLLFFTIRPHDEWIPEGYSILGVDSPRGDHQHAVVALNGEIVWDPHPARDMGVGKRRDYTVFQALDPAKT